MLKKRFRFTTLNATLTAAALVTACGGGEGEAPHLAQASAATPAMSKRQDASPSDTAAMRAAWQAYVSGGALDLSDPEISSKVTAIATAANNAQNAMVPAASRTNCLWTDLCTWTASVTLTNNFARVQAMMLGYVTQGSSLYQNAALLAKIQDALQWLYTNKYNAGVAQYDNWYEWEIGVPKVLGSILITLYEQLPATLRASYVTALDHFNADPTIQTWPVYANPTLSTGANLLDKVMGRVFSGMLADDAGKISAARTAMQAVYANVTSGDGFYADGSFVQHGYIAYMGGYGQPLIDDIGNLMLLAKGTPWAFSAAEAQVVAGWVNDSITPLIYQGGMLDMTRGRGISRSSSTDHAVGRAMAASVRRLADGMDAVSAAQVNATVKGWILGDTVYSHVSGCTSNCYYANTGVYDTTRMKALTADATVTATQVQTSRVYAGMARAVHHTPTFSAALAMFSDRISSFEFGNNENKKGWLTGAGMLAVNTDDQKQFGGNFWATVDYARLPGTTVDGASFTAPVQWKFYGNAQGSNSWTGGSSALGAYSSAGMEFDMSGFLSRETPPRASPSHLSGRKSWFMLGDRIFAMGSDLHDDVGRPVETIVDNRQLQAPFTGNAGGANKLTINGSAYTAAAMGAGPQMAWGVSWAHLQGSVASTCSPAVNGASCTTGSKGMGYVFPKWGQPLTVLREARTGAWSDVGTGSATAVTANYLSLAIPHNEAPYTDEFLGDYQYILLPNKSAAEVSAIAASTGIDVLAALNGTHAVMYTPASGNVVRVVGANFWLPEGGTITDVAGTPLLSVSTKASVTVAETAGGVTLALSDPTEANTGTVEVEYSYHGATSVAGTLDSAVTVIQLAPTIKLSINVNGARGRNVVATFNY